MTPDNKYPIGGFAPGNYQCKCCDCGKLFIGDKRAVQCEPCAEASIKPAITRTRAAEILKQFQEPKPTIMTPEELLTPRYKVIADYPSNDYDVGEIICLTNNNGESDEYYSVTDDGDMIEWERFYKNFPNIFKPMLWYEGRGASDMPEYVKRNYEGRILFYKKELTTIGSGFKYNGLPEGEPPLLNFIGCCIPATREEYEAYQLKTQQP